MGPPSNPTGKIFPSRGQDSVGQASLKRKRIDNVIPMNTENKARK
jgi:hypothetical protein